MRTLGSWRALVALIGGTALVLLLALGGALETRTQALTNSGPATTLAPIHPALDAGRLP